VDALRERLRRAQAEFLETIEGVDERARAVGEWSVRDVVAHLIDWNEEIRLAAEHLLRRRERPAHHPIVEIERFNAESAARRAVQEWRELKGELAGTVERAIELAGHFEGRLEEPCEHPWNNRGTIRDLFHGVCGHQEEHTEELRAWRA
jgi:hypothetical protein